MDFSKNICMVFLFFSSEVLFLRSEFKDQLPKSYSHLKDATPLRNNHFNNTNKEIDRYVSFIFDL